MLSSFALVTCVLLPMAPVSAVGTAFVSCRHICLIINVTFIDVLVCVANKFDLI